MGLCERHGGQVVVGDNARGQTFHQELLSPANAYDVDEKIDFLDYSIMANNWLDEILWP